MALNNSLHDLVDYAKALRNELVLIDRDSVASHTTYTLEDKPEVRYLEISLPGFSKESLEVSVQESTKTCLVVKAKAMKYPNRKYTFPAPYLRGQFLRYELKSNTQVGSVTYENGLLTIELLEKLNPNTRVISIN